MNMNTNLPLTNVNPDSVKTYAVKALELLIAGHEPIPIAPGEKYPITKDWRNTNCRQLVKQWPPNHGIGLRTGKLVAIDIDIYQADIVGMLYLHLLEHHPGIIFRVGQAPKLLIPIRCPEVLKKITSRKWVDEHGVLHQIEILSYGQQFVAHGIHPDTSQPYKWCGDLLTQPPPTVTLEEIHQLFAYLDKLAAEKGWTNLSKVEEKANKVVAARRPRNSSGQPGSIYNQVVPIHLLLQHYGWTPYRGNYWTRPGKNTGVSGSILNNEVFYPFTSSTCLEEETVHDAFELLTQYEFKGNKTACVRALYKHMKDVS